MSTALGVAQSAAGVGMSDHDLRLTLGADWASTGVVGDGLAVTGTTSLVYQVSAGVAICSKGASDGKTKAPFLGGTTPTVEANSAGNPRIDCIWITSHDLTQGDSDNLVTLGVTQGTAAATPTAPTIPTYATLLAQMTMPAGATTTANAVQAASIGYAIPYGASLGKLGDTTWPQSADYSSAITLPAQSFYLPTQRLVSVEVTVTCSSLSGSDGSVYVKIYLDGTVKRTFEHRTFPASATSGFFRDVWTVPAGNHVVYATIAPGIANFHTYGTGDADSWAGQRLMTFDEGVA
jgi:hypothetical protein